MKQVADAVPLKMKEGKTDESYRNDFQGPQVVRQRHGKGPHGRGWVVEHGVGLRRRYSVVLVGILSLSRVVQR